MRTTPLLPCLLLLASCGENLTHPTQHDPYDAGTQAPLECVPNLDGKISAAELQVFYNIPVTYLVSPAGQERPVDVAGGSDMNGNRIWDWSTDIASDQEWKLVAEKLEGKWYATSFPSGQFVTPFDASHSIDAVYRHDDEAVWLLGLASVVQDPAEGRTLMVYGQPVALYRFPIAPGAEYVSTGTIENGVVKGLPYAGKDIYEVKFDAIGTLKLPSLTFTQVHRARTRVTVQPAVGASTSQRQVSFLFECFGEVARATSLPTEQAEDFTTASEVRRMGLAP
jgi:hypothetical protein